MKILQKCLFHNYLSNQILFIYLFTVFSLENIRGDVGAPSVPKPLNGPVFIGLNLIVYLCINDINEHHVKQLKCNYINKNMF